jgi:hypothetical protein
MMFRYRKAITAGLLGAVLALVLAACGGDDPTPTPRATATPVPAADPTATPTALPPGVATPTPRPAATATPVPPTATPEPSFDAEAYFKGKTIRLMVGFNPGGGTDAQARLMGRKWPQFIPGNPRIVVTNLTPDLVMRNFVWAADPSGFVVGLGATPGIFDMNEDAADFDVREVSFIGGSSGFENFWAIWNAALPDYGCIDTAFNQVGIGPTITVADSIPSPTEIGSGPFLTAWLSHKFDIPYQLISVASTGSASQMLMLERGDINSWTTATVWNQLPRTRPGWVRDGILKPFADLSFPGTTQGPNSEGAFTCPNVTEYIADEDQAEWLAFNGPRTFLSKNMWGPPGMEADVLNTLRQAWADAFSDEQFIADVATFTGIPTILTEGAEGAAILKEVTDGFLANADRFKELQLIFFDKYVK